MNYKDINNQIHKLELLVGSGLFLSESDLKEAWALIKSIKFKGIKFPTHQQHQEAWSRFQNLIEITKKSQKEQNATWERRKQNSLDIKEKIISRAKYAKPPNGFDKALVHIITLGQSYAGKLLLDSIMQPFDDRKYELQNSSNELKEAWDMFSEHKVQMLGYDKSQTYQVLCEIKEEIDYAWKKYHNERQEAFYNYKKIREENRERRLRKIEQNIQNLENKIENLNSILDHKNNHLEKLREDLYGANTENYRSRVECWIYEEESKVDDIREKISQCEIWIEKERNKLT